MFRPILIAVCVPLENAGIILFAFAVVITVVEILNSEIGKISASRTADKMPNFYNDFR